MVDNYAAFFNCTPVSGVRLYGCPDIKLFILVGWGRSFANRSSTGVFLVSYWTPRDLHRRAAYSICEYSFLIHHGIIIINLFVHDDSLTSQ